MAATTSFVGRAHELTLIAALFERGERLVTLLGPGGIGKTRLALRYAGEAAIACDLAEATTAAAMCEVMCDALDVTLGPRAKLDAAIDPIGHVLAARGDALVVLDNFEQLVDNSARALARWLELAPAAKFLVTSRERLKLAREVVLDVGPLELTTDAVALFVERARAARAIWQPTASDTAAIAEIVRRLDGFPLAIELAAPRCRVLAPGELAARLAEGLAILDRGPRDGAARHATLADAIAWSVDSLSPAERAALAQCAVFRGGFSIAAAEAVLDGGAPVVELLHALADKSLVTIRDVSGATRFDLYATIRELVAKSDPICETRHAAYYVALGERAIVKAPGSESRHRLELERENLVAAHARAAARLDHAELAARAALVLDDVLAWRGPLSANLALLDAA
ncbi:MAG TPA: AAA family ATPase, partial [Kofleriaceae bacterium]|nr:AAA family ATPase [Kofleriaceae bacterium]